MRYFRLLKDTPSANAGTILFEESYGRFVGDGRFCRIVAIEEIVLQTEWFEEVEQIFVRPHNTEKLVELDRLSDGDRAEIANFAVVRGN